MNKDEMEATIYNLTQLCRFLANHQSDQRNSMMKAISKDNYGDVEKMREQILMHTPVIQGSRNQWDLTAIGKHKTDRKVIRNAINYLLNQDK